MTSTDSDRTLILLPPTPAILMAQFTTKITKRYPADEVFTLQNPNQSISFYCELQAMKGKQIVHRWYHGNELRYEASFKIRAEQWRIWSTQLLPEDQPGEWKVEIVDEAGEVLAVHKLNFEPQASTLAAN